MSVIRRLSIFLLLSCLCFSILGCAVSAEDRLVGVWTPDTKGSVIPVIPIPGTETKVKTALANTLLKIRSDRTFLLVSAPTVSAEGKWKLESDVITFTSSKPMEGPMGAFGSEIKGQVKPNGIVLKQDTPFGPVEIAFRKSA